MDPGRLHELVPVLLALAADGDEIARSVVFHLADEIVVLAAVALRRLNLLESPAEVVLGGGVIAARSPLLVDAIETRMRERAPRAVIRIVDEPPVTGAALLGLDTRRKPAALRDQLRQELHSRAAAERQWRSA
jgi:predicted NBD/HSP70 family sugar kinase